MAWRTHIEPLERVRFFAGERLIEIFGAVGELRGEFGDQIRANFVAARANGRAEGRKDVARL